MFSIFLGKCYFVSLWISWLDQLKTEWWHVFLCFFYPALYWNIMMISFSYWWRFFMTFFSRVFINSDKVSNLTALSLFNFFVAVYHLSRELQEKSFLPNSSIFVLFPCSVIPDESWIASKRQTDRFTPLLWKGCSHSYAYFFMKK